MAEYVAIRLIKAPNTLINGYAPGDPVSAWTVREWGLGEDDVRLADDYEAPRPAEDDNNRMAWEAYVVGQGTSEAEARAASLATLKDLHEAPPPPEKPAWQVNDERASQSGSVRPAESAKKAEWVEYVIRSGADEEWANSSSTTKDDLIDWQPGG